MWPSIRHRRAPLDDLAGDVRLAGKEGEAGRLGVVPRAVVVVPPLLGDPLRAREEPVEVGAEPRLHPLLVRFGPDVRKGQQPNGLRHRDEPVRVDDADAAPFHPTGDGLPVLEVRVHFGRRVEEPRPEQARGVFGVPFFVGEVVGQRQRLDGARHPAHAGRVGGAGGGLRVALAVAADVGEAVGLRRVRPPVRPEAEVVVLVAAGRGLRLVGDRERPHLQRRVGLGDELLEGRLQARVALGESRLRVQKRFRYEGKNPERVGADVGCGEGRKQQGQTDW